MPLEDICFGSRADDRVARFADLREFTQWCVAIADWIANEYGDGVVLAIEQLYRATTIASRETHQHKAPRPPRQFALRKYTLSIRVADRLVAPAAAK